MIPFLYMELFSQNLVSFLSSGEEMTDLFSFLITEFYLSS